jgi:hypothetical protein
MIFLVKQFFIYFYLFKKPCVTKRTEDGRCSQESARKYHRL